MSYFLVMAGGTGGHVMPALCFAECARERGHRLSWLGTAAGLEARLVPAAGLELATIDMAGVRGRGVGGWLAAPFRLARALWQVLCLLRRRRPDLVIGFGGYSSAPGGLAAKLLRVPLVIHEQNAVAGTANRLLARMADRVLCGLADVLPRARVVGNPVRAAIFAVARARAEAGRVRLLVLGGSLGARFLNQTLPQALAVLPAAERPQVRHQAGEQAVQETRDAYAAAGVEAEVVPFIDVMVAAYEWADLAVCRAGAMTVAELAAAGLPALLVPYPHAIDDHQSANAQVLVRAGAAQVYRQDEAGLDAFAARLRELLVDGEKRRGMGRAARACARPQAAADMVRICEELAHVP